MDNSKESTIDSLVDCTSAVDIDGSVLCYWPGGCHIPGGGQGERKTVFADYDGRQIIDIKPVCPHIKPKTKCMFEGTEPEYTIAVKTDESGKRHLMRVKLRGN